MSAFCSISSGSNNSDFSSAAEAAVGRERGERSLSVVWLLY